VNHRIFERILRSLVFRGACLFECREYSQFQSFCLKLDLDVVVVFTLRLVLNALAICLDHTQCDKYMHCYNQVMTASNCRQDKDMSFDLKSGRTTR
jgi:hypothetical protein